MTTRREKNKVIEKKIKKEKSINYSKNIIKCFFAFTIMFILVYLNLRFYGTSFIKTKEYMITSDLIPSNFNGVKILHFSDLLYGSSILDDDLQYLTKEFKKIKPDIVIFTGDIIKPNYELSKRELSNIEKFFQEIPYTIGKYSVKGENDFQTFDYIMNESSFNVLNNNYKLIYYKENKPIAIANNTKDEKLNDLYTISIIHNFDDYNQSCKSDLILAGHNLNGEVYIPFYKGLLGNNKYNDSYYKINNTDIYISNGLGTLHNLRMFNHPSINVYRLISK